MIAPQLTPPERMKRIRTLLPELQVLDALHHDTALPLQKRAEAGNGIVDRCLEIVAHLNALEDCGALKDAEDVIEFAYQGVA